MKILINITGVKYGGSLTDAGNILDQLARLNKNDEYYVLLSGVIRDKIPLLPINFHIVTLPWVDKSWIIHFIYDQVFLPIFVWLKKIKVLLSFNFASFLANCFQMIRLTQPVCFSSLVLERMHSGGLRYILRIFIYRNLILLSIKKADKVIFLSETLKQDISRFIKLANNLNKYIVSYNGVDARFLALEQDREPPHINLGNHTFKIFYPAFYHFHKNFLILFKAMVEFKKKVNRDFRLILTIKLKDISRKERRNILMIIKESDLSLHLQFLGGVPYIKMPSIYRQVDLVVFPSFAEACPNPLPEAMSLGLPIVASDIPVHREICLDAAIYFDVFNPEDLADKIILLMEDRQLCKQLAINGKERAKQFSWQEHVSKIHNAIEELKRG